MKTTIKETIEWLKNVDEELKKEFIKKVTHTAFKKTLEYAKVHTKTGRMESNIKARVKKNRGEILIDDDGMVVDWRGKKVNYANFVLYGTRPHLICPKNKKALRFFQKFDVFRFKDKCIHHPGYRGDDFLKRAVEDTFKKLDEIAKRIKIWHYKSI